MKFDSVRDDYSRLWESVQIRPERRAVVEASAKRIMSKRARYQAVSAETGVPWYVVGIIHKMECDLAFDKHLHCGDPLSDRTKRVPKGRPKTGNPPFSWKESAIDAIKYDGLHKHTDWSPEGIAYCLETFNGWGYRPKKINSPYLWSFTYHYASGKYVADSVWDASAQSSQSGGMALLKALTELDPSILPTSDEASPDAMPTPMLPADESERLPRVRPPTPMETVNDSKTLWSLITGAATAAVTIVTDWFKQGFEFVLWVLGVLPSVKNEVGTAVESTEQFSKWLNIPWTKIGFGVVLATMLVAFVRHYWDKRKAEGAQ